MSRKEYTTKEFIQEIKDHNWHKSMGLALHFNKYGYDYMISDAKVIKNKNKYLLTLHDAEDKKITVELMDVIEGDINQIQLENGYKNPDNFLAAVVSHNGVENFITNYSETNRSDNEKELMEAVIIDFLEFTGIIYKYQLLQVFKDADDIVDEEYKKNQMMYQTMMATQTNQTNQTNKPKPSQKQDSTFKPLGENKVITDKTGKTYHI